MNNGLNNINYSTGQVENETILFPFSLSFFHFSFGRKLPLESLS